jgi:hypothetical protein
MPANGLSQMPAARRTSPSAIAALLCGILTFCGLAPAAIAAMGSGTRRCPIRRTGDDGYGLAKGGLILGYLGLVLTAFVRSARWVHGPLGDTTRQRCSCPPRRTTLS